MERLIVLKYIILCKVQKTPIKPLKLEERKDKLENCPFFILQKRSSFHFILWQNSKPQYLKFFS